MAKVYDGIGAGMAAWIVQQPVFFVATAPLAAGGMVNLSPKGTTAVWDDDHLAFCNIASPGTLANLRKNPSVEVNVIDQLVRKGYRFKGVATILESGPAYEKAIAFFRARGVQSKIGEVVVIEVRSAAPIHSPAYDRGATEEQLRARWERGYTAYDIIDLSVALAPRIDEILEEARKNEALRQAAEDWEKLKKYGPLMPLAPLFEQ